VSDCFADTYFFLALLFENDEDHARAQTMAAELQEARSSHPLAGARKRG
jgi:hypothetical protein